jgi:hypothetical protein
VDVSVSVGNGVKVSVNVGVGGRGVNVSVGGTLVNVLDAVGEDEAGSPTPETVHDRAVRIKRVKMRRYLFFTP